MPSASVIVSPTFSRTDGGFVTKLRYAFPLPSSCVLTSLPCASFATVTNRQFSGPPRKASFAIPNPPPSPTPFPDTKAGRNLSTICSGSIPGPLSAIENINPPRDHTILGSLLLFCAASNAFWNTSFPTVCHNCLAYILSPRTAIMRDRSAPLSCLSDGVSSGAATVGPA